MKQDAPISVALREWAVICAGLASGAICAVVRKGGIHEQRGGLFQLQHRRFLLLPGAEHQEPQRLAPWLQTVTPKPVHPDQLEMHHGAEVIADYRIEHPETCQALATLQGVQGFSEAELLTRFAYRDQPWLQVLLLRVWTLPQALIIPREQRHAGCRSWLPLATAADLQGSSPVLPDATLAARQRQLEALLPHPIHPPSE